MKTTARRCILFYSIKWPAQQQWHHSWNFNMFCLLFAPTSFFPFLYLRPRNQFFSFWRFPLFSLNIYFCLKKSSTSYLFLKNIFIVKFSISVLRITTFFTVCKQDLSVFKIYLSLRISFFLKDNRWCNTLLCDANALSYEMWFKTIVSTCKTH